jgi:hypothetical protein
MTTSHPVFEHPFIETSVFPEIFSEALKFASKILTFINIAALKMFSALPLL